MKYMKQRMEPHNKQRLKMIGEILKQYRMFNFMSREYIEDTYLLSRSVVERAERGENITVYTLFRLLDVYDINADELFREVENL